MLQFQPGNKDVVCAVIHLISVIGCDLLSLFYKVIVNNFALICISAASKVYIKHDNSMRCARWSSGCTTI